MKKFSLLLSLAITLAAAPSAQGGETGPLHRRAVISIHGMMCASCGQEVAMALRRLAGVNEVSVDTAKDLAVVTYDERKITATQMVEAVRRVGYEAALIAPRP